MASYFVGIVILAFPIVICMDKDVRAMGTKGLIALSCIFGPIFGCWFSWHWSKFSSLRPKTRKEWIAAMIQGALISLVMQVLRK